MIVASRKADIIIGPVGIVVADSLLGEVSEKMAAAVGKSEAVKILVPINRCNNIVVGVKCDSINEMIEETVKTAGELLD